MFWARPRWRKEGSEEARKEWRGEGTEKAKTKMRRPVKLFSHERKFPWCFDAFFQHPEKKGFWGLRDGDGDTLKPRLGRGISLKSNQQIIWAQSIYIWCLPSSTMSYKQTSTLTWWLMNNMHCETEWYRTRLECSRHTEILIRSIKSRLRLWNGNSVVHMLARSAASLTWTVMSQMLNPDNNTNTHWVAMTRPSRAKSVCT